MRDYHVCCGNYVDRLRQICSYAAANLLQLATNFAVNLQIWSRQNMSWWSRQIRGYSCSKESEKGRGKVGKKCRGKYMVKLTCREKNILPRRDKVAANCRGKYAIKLPRKEKFFCRDKVEAKSRQIVAVNMWENGCVGKKILPRLCRVAAKSW
jgi:hypothetical protein